MQHFLLLFIILVIAPSFINAQDCVDILKDKEEIYLHETITFEGKAEGYCEPCGDGYVPESYSWIFEGTKASSKSKAGPHRISFNRVGTLKAKLTVTYFLPDKEDAPSCSRTYVTTVKVKPRSSLELESFEATSDNTRIRLYWTTLYENDNEVFIIEKSSDNETYNELALVESRGNHSNKEIYNVEDNDPAKGKTWYRLKYKDDDGAVHELANVDVTWYNINETLDLQHGEKVLIVVQDEGGNEIFSKVVLQNMDQDSIYAVDPSHKIPPGSYMIVGSSKNEIHNKQLVVVNNFKGE